MSEKPETKELDPKEEITITREKFQQELQKAHSKGFEIGSSEKYRTLGEMLFGMVEVYAKALKPKEAPYQNFLKFVVYAIERQYLESYEDKNEKEEQPVQEDGKSQEAPEGGHQDVPEGSEGGQEVSEESKEKEEVTA